MLKNTKIKIVLILAVYALIFVGSTAFLTKSNALFSGSVNSSLTQFNNVSLTGDLSQMKYFFSALKDTKGKKVRIAHFGDSIIEGDLISSDLRQFFQEKFGGNGAGFLSMNSYDIQFRKSTRHTFSDNWKSASLFTKNPDKLPMGMNGCAFQAAENGWVKFEVSNYSKTLKSFKNVRVFYTNSASNAVIKYSFNNGSAQTAKLPVSGAKVKELLLTSATDATSLQMNFSSCGTTVFFGASLENGNGVYIDNFPLRGNSGGSIVDISSSVLKDFNDIMNYKLIILQFGLNVLTTEVSDYTWYVNKMDKVISYFKQSFPNTSILIVSVGDKSVKQGSKYVTDPSVFALIKAQKTIADNNKVAFWNMFEAMGGKNSMSNFVNANPPLAFKDYSHFTYEGATKIGDLFWQSLMDEYKRAN
ncbi:MAG: hypothetical protein WCJ01_06180 [Ignavibacteria bacterium]